MDTRKHQYKLDQIPANRSLVDELYTNNKISRAAREFALDFLYPHDQWGLWVSRLLLIIGATLILSGIVYFFAFNWAEITPTVKLTAIQVGVVGCLLGAYIYSLERMSEQVLLLSASVLVGVFLAVFGQIYQTGADAYQLFMAWSLLILGWTVISKFAAQWALWLVVTNIFLSFWWQQAALPAREWEFMIFVYMAILNGLILILREYFIIKHKPEWLAAKWIRVVLVIALLVIMLIPIMLLILELGATTDSLTIASIIGVAGHIAVYFVYRNKIKDIWALAATVLSWCLIIETLGVRILFDRGWDVGPFLLSGLMTLGIFTCAIIHLRKVSTDMEIENV